MQLSLFDDILETTQEHVADRRGLAAPRSETENGQKAYRDYLFSGVPLYTTRLVRETTFRFAERTQVSTPADVAEALILYFADKDREECLVALVDTANTLIGLAQISVGGLSASIVEPRQVFKVAILANAAGVICLHNHPSGNPEPSRVMWRMLIRE